jgi:MFS family permease
MNIKENTVATELSIPKFRIKSLSFYSIVACQFLAAFNDNGFRQAVILLAYARYANDVAVSIAGASTAAMLLPFAFFSIFAGQCSDRFPKYKVLRFAKLIEIPLVGIGLWGLLGAEVLDVSIIVLLILMLFGLGLQTAFLGPARMGILPEILEEKDLPEANGILELGNYTGILSGTMVAGFIVQGLFFPDTFGEWKDVARVGALCVLPAAAILGAIASFWVPKVPAANPEGKLLTAFRPQQFYVNLKIMSQYPWLLKCTVGLCIFWSVCTFYMLNIPIYAQELLGFDGKDTAAGTTILLTMLSIGSGVGCIFAGIAAKKTIRLDFLNTASSMWIIAGLGLGSLGFVDLTPSVMIWAIGFFILLAGFSAGFFVVPLSAYIEAKSPTKELASFIGTNNVVTTFAMIAAAGLHPFIVANLGGASLGFILISSVVVIPFFWKKPGNVDSL